MHDILELDSFTKAYGERTILTDIYLKCETGDIIALFGRNGAGKSTLLKILFGIEKGDSKFIRINGKRIGSQSESFREISYLSQDTLLPHYLKVSHVIRLTISKDRVDGFMDDPVIKLILNNLVSGLSGGELRYLEIKLLLHLTSKFVLLDEPFNGLSPLMIEQVIEMIKTHSARKGIILTDHDYRNVLKVSNRYTILNNGNLKSMDNKEDLVRFGYLSSMENDKE